jgi:hypothetical protein
MTRTSRGDQIVVKPKNDVYTALLVTSFVVVVLGLLAMVVQSNAVFGDGLFFPSNTNNPAAAVR